MRAVERVQIPDPAPARRQLERRLSNKSIGKRPQESDDSDDLVTRSGARSRKRVEIYASGGVANGDQVNVTPSRATRSRRLREDTDEILSERERSRNSSRTGSDVDGAAVSSAKPRGTNAKSTATSTDKTREPVEARGSVLGTFRPRKRQASILQLIDNNESTIMSDDEREFLPDEVSTPAASKTTPLRPISTSTNRTYSSLKRKRDSTIGGPVMAPTVGAPEAVNVAAPSRTQKKKLVEKQRVEDDIMALPQSSDDDDDDEGLDNEPEQPRVELSASKRKTSAPTTEQLQSLMPSKKRSATSAREKKSIFDLPDDSQDVSEEVSEDENNHSAFLPARSGRANTRSAKSRSTAKSSGLLSRTTKSRGTRTSSTPSPVRLRTPLPLSASKFAKKRTPAKSPSKQVEITTTTRTPLRDRSTNIAPTSALGRKDRGKKQYGGSLGRTRAATMQENEAIDVDESSDGELRDVKGVRTEATAWKKQWADIDNFEMEFEEVSYSSSGDPMAR